MIVKQAYFVRALSGRGNAALYRLDPPLEGVDFLAVSDVDVLGRGETLAFVARDSGPGLHDAVVAWGGLDCSVVGVRSHAECLARAGYEIVQADKKVEES